MHIFPIGKGAFVGKLKVSANDLKTFSESSQIATVVLLDCSGSMGGWVQVVVKSILPELFKSLGYGADDPITILAFDSTCEVCKWTIATAKDCHLSNSGGTNFEPAIMHLSAYLEMAEARGASVRVLAISDGEICDKERSLRAAEVLNQQFRSKIRINSQSVQLFSSDFANPDTVALCSLLRLNNTKSAKLVNIFKKTSSTARVAMIKESISGDNLEFNVQIKCEKPLFKKDLWEPDMKASLNMLEGNNLFWIDASQVEDVFSGKLKITFGNSLTPIKVIHEVGKNDLGDVCSLLKDQIEYVYEYLKVLRIINTDISHKTMAEIVNEYRILEDQLKDANEVPALQILAKNDMSSRLAYLREEIRKRNRGFTMRMARIANDSTIDMLNSAQKAEYLRSTDHSKTSRGLAKRAATSGFDFDSIAQGEAMAIAANLNELTSFVKDSNHQCSFYSMETTLGGIKAVAQMVMDPGFDELTANEILLLLNIVGIACDGPVGDFPDPMTWRVNKIYPGVFVSVSDLMTSRLQSGSPDSFMQVPGHSNSRITNVIPVFEDIRIAKFLQKHAPYLLSYTCSIGMRGMIAHVPMTDGYTLCAGIWKLVEHIASNPTELNLNTFKHLVVSYDFFCAFYFKDAQACAKMDPVTDENGVLTSFYLCNNGVTNMIAPLYNSLRSKNSSRYTCFRSNIPAILRALFSYEIWQVFRREFKGAESESKVDEMLSKLLGIDLDKYAVQMPPLFEKELSADQIKFYGVPHFDFAYLKKFLDSKGWYLKYVSIIILLLDHVEKDTLGTVANPSNLEECLKDENFLKAQYGLPNDYDFKEYLMYSAVQSLLYPKMSDRVDQRCSKMKMLISDLIDPTQIKEQIRLFIRSKFQSRYESERVQRRKAENFELLNTFLNEISTCTKRSKLIELFKTGVSRGLKTYCFSGANSYGCVELKNLILNVGSPVPLRKDILKIFMTACDLDDGKVELFNSGKVAVEAQISEFERVFLENCQGTPGEWKIIFDEYKIRNIHSYRDNLENRHGHHNGKPSYWALGYATLEVYAQEHTIDEFEEYCTIHYNCCGVNQFNPVQIEGNE